MINLKADNFNEKIDEGNSLVFFWGPNCNRCHSLKPLIEDIEGDYDNIGFYDVNIGDSRALAKREGVRSLPTLIHYENGEAKESINGINANLDYILDYLDSIA